MVAIRRGDSGDVPGLLRIYTQSFREQGRGVYSEEQLAQLAPTGRAKEFASQVIDRPDRVVLVAEEDGELVGWGGVRLDDGSLLGVYVAPGAMNHGIGRAVLEAVERTAYHEGLRTLSVFAALNAVGFYEACGYIRVGKRDARGRVGPLGSYGTSSDGVPLPVVELEKQVGSPA